MPLGPRPFAEARSALNAQWDMPPSAPPPQCVQCPPSLFSAKSYRPQVFTILFGFSDQIGSPLMRRARGGFKHFQKLLYGTSEAALAPFPRSISGFW